MSQPTTPAGAVAGLRARRAWMLALLMAAGLAAQPARAGDDEPERAPGAHRRRARVQTMVAKAAQDASTGQREIPLRLAGARFRQMPSMHEHADGAATATPGAALRGDYRQ